MHRTVRITCDIILAMLAGWFFVAGRQGFVALFQNGFGTALNLATVAIAIGFILFIDHLSTELHPIVSVFITTYLLICAVGEHYDVVYRLVNLTGYAWRTVDLAMVPATILVATLVAASVGTLMVRAHPKG